MQVAGGSCGARGGGSIPSTKAVLTVISSVVWSGSRSKNDRARPSVGPTLAEEQVADLRTHMGTREYFCRRVSVR